MFDPQPAGNDLDLDFEEWLPDTAPLDRGGRPGFDVDPDFDEPDDVFGSQVGDDDLWESAAPERPSAKAAIARAGRPPVEMIAAIGLGSGLLLSLIDPGGPAGYIRALIFGLLGRPLPSGEGTLPAAAALGDLAILVSMVLLMVGALAGAKLGGARGPVDSGYDFDDRGRHGTGGREAGGRGGPGVAGVAGHLRSAFRSAREQGAQELDQFGPPDGRRGPRR